MKQQKAIAHLNYKVKIIKGINNNEIKHLTFADPADALKFDSFLNTLVEDQHVEVFYDANKDDGTLGQLAKIHACIRQIAIDTGSSFEEVKFDTKRLAGLCVAKEINGINYLVCKSLGKSSKEELNLVIETIKDIGDTVGINFH